MNALLLIACTLGCQLFVLGSAAYVRQTEGVMKKPIEESKQLGQDTEKVAQMPPNDPRSSFYVDRYSPEVARILSSPRLMEELYEAIQYHQQLSSQQADYQRAAELGAVNKRAQTFVRFGKRAQTFVRFGRR